MQFGQIIHDDEFSFVVRELFEHVFIHELDSDDFVLTDPISFENDTEVTLTKNFWLVDVEVVCYLLHAFLLHLSFLKITIFVDAY